MITQESKEAKLSISLISIRMKSSLGSMVRIDGILLLYIQNKCKLYIYKIK